MKDKGKKLESLVKAVEEIFLPAGFQVTQRRKVYNKKGTQLAEFDLDIRGMVGSKEYGWLIECRDRPSGGPAPSSWIEQLVGRRGRFSFDKVTAVSTTGLSVSATEYATREGIELKTVESITVQETLNWLSNDSILVTYTRAKKLGVLVPTSIGTERYAAMRAILKAASFDDKVYYHPHDKVSYSLNHLFSWYCKKRPALVSGMKLNSEPKVVNAIIRTPSSVSKNASYYQ